MDNQVHGEKVKEAADTYAFGKLPEIPMPELQGKNIQRIWTDYLCSNL